MASAQLFFVPWHCTLCHGLVLHTVALRFVLQHFALCHGVRLHGAALCIMLGILFCVADIVLATCLSFVPFTFVENMEKQSTDSIGESVHW